MAKKSAPKEIKAASSNKSSTGEAKVISMLGKLEKRTEKQLSAFVKEIVKLKKNQAKLEKKLEQVKAVKPKNLKKVVKSSKKKKGPQLTLVKTDSQKKD